MKKQLDTQGMLNELKRGSRFFAPAPLPPATHPSAVRTFGPTSGQTIDPSTHESTGLPANPSTPESTAQSVDRSPILGRPKAFYITQQQDRDLDGVVARLAERAAGKVAHKIDRSTVLRLLLEGANLTSEQTSERLYGQLVRRLIRQLTG